MASNSGVQRQKYKQRRAARMNGQPMKARPFHPWWVTQGALPHQSNYYTHGPYAELPSDAEIGRRRSALRMAAARVAA